MVLACKFQAISANDDDVAVLWSSQRASLPEQEANDVSTAEVADDDYNLEEGFAGAAESATAG